MNQHTWRPKRSRPTTNRGSSLIEVLVSLLIMTFGMLGLAGLQNHAQVAELESYQRQQALILLEDMAARMANNKPNTASYVTASPLGTSATDAANCSAETTLKGIDQCDWSKMLKGAAEVKGSAKLGAMIGARGCINVVDPGKEYSIAVVWQGMNKTVSPANACGAGLYDSNETRRAVTTIVRVADLAAP